VVAFPVAPRGVVDVLVVVAVDEFVEVVVVEVLAVVVTGNSDSEK
jgi:hypothetical protein